MRPNRAQAKALLLVTGAVVFGGHVALAQAPALTVDANASRHAISPEIYGIASYGLDATFAKEIQVPNIRWGGDGTTRYNWLVDSSNAGFDWYFMGGNGQATPVPSASAELPAGTGLTLGQIANINLTGSEKYFVYKLRTPLTNFFFNSSLLVPGQHISIGGPLSGAGNSQSVTTHRVVLRHEGHLGQWVVGSTNTANNTFSFNSDGLAGVLFNGPITVYTTPAIQYLGGLSGLSDLSGSSAISIRVVGLVLKNPATQQPVFVARSVEELQ
jgi:hypothetical protein